jgi:D-alanyl-D-alanine carboxypeptidase (penicillin-binding protein 5/6)
MKPFFQVLLRALSLTLGLATQALAQMPQPPDVAVKAYLLVDVTANQVLAAKDPDMAVEPASLTKLMTAHLVFDALRAKKLSLQQALPVSERAWRMSGARMFIDPKMRVPVDDLIKGMVVQSGNDATMALAEAVGGSAERFVQLMNEQAKALGMKGTAYKNPDGQAEPGHTTTTRDLGILAQRLMRDFPQYLPYYAIKKYRYAGTPAANDTNRNLLLLRDPTVDGLQAGHTPTAGYGQVSTAKREFPNVGQRRLLAVVLGAESENARANESQRLLNWGYAAFDAVKLFDAGQAVTTPKVWKGQAPEVRLGVAWPLVVAVPAGTVAQIKTQVSRPDPVVAPLKKGQSLGSLKVLKDEQALLEVPLTVLDGVEQAGVFGRAWDAVRLWIK